MNIFTIIYWRPLENIRIIVDVVRGYQLACDMIDDLSESLDIDVLEWYTLE